MNSPKAADIQVRLAAQKAALSARIKDGWKDEVDAFKTLRKKYLLYEE